MPPSAPPDIRLSVPEAFQRFLHPYEGAGHFAGEQLDEAMRIGGGAPRGVRSWFGDALVDPNSYGRHFGVLTKELPDNQWDVKIWPKGPPVDPRFAEQGLWSVSANDVDARIRLEQEAAGALDRLEREQEIIREALDTLNRLMQGRLVQDSEVTETLDQLKQGFERIEGDLDKLKQNVGQSLPAQNPRGAGRRRKFDREFILIEAAAHVWINGLPSQLDELVVQLQEALSDDMPKDTLAKEILGPFFTRMEQVLGR
jgi:hypothetical protein